MRMGIGLGVGINRSNYAQGIFNAYNARVIADGGITEAGACVDAVSALLQTASLLLIPSGYKGGKAYAEIPTNGNGDLTWTRASDAWRTNADGLIQRVPWNLLTYSEVFTVSSWTKTYVTASGSTTIAPDGNLTADTLSVGVDAVSVRHRMHSSFFNSQVIGTTYTSTYYLKANEHQWIQILGNIGYSTGVWANFDLVNGIIGNTGGTDTTASIENVGNGWYRCRVSGVATGTTTTGFEVIVINNTNGGRYPSYQSSTAADVCYIWGAQLVEGSSAQTYFPTTDRLNVPRLSYMYGSCPALLLEPQRTNLITYSNDFTDASWVKSFTSITGNTTTSPDGGTNAHTFAADGTAASHTLQKALSLTSGITYSISIFAKKGTNNFIQLTASAALFGTNFFANYDLNNGVLGTVGSSATATIVPLQNGWYRCTITGAAIATTLSNIAATIISSSTSTRLESNSLSTSVFIYGAQFEAGAYPTTYIATTTASATRIADSFSRSNIYTNGLITSSGGTWFVELRGNLAYTRDSTMLLGLGDNTALSQNSLALTNSTSGRMILRKYVSGSASTLFTTTTDTVKLAIKWNGTSADVFVNGTKQVSATSFTTTIMENLLNTATGTPVFIQAMALYPTPLSDTDCTTLTTL